MMPVKLESTQEETESRKILMKKIRGQINKDLTEEQHNRLANLLDKRIKCFAANDMDMGYCTAAEHTIDTGDSKPIHQAPYKNAWKERVLIQQEVNKML